MHGHTSQRTNAPLDGRLHGDAVRLPPRGLLVLLALAAPIGGCIRAPSGDAARETDICDGLDNDRDGLIDEGGCSATYPCARGDCVCAITHERCETLCVPRAGPRSYCDGVCRLLDRDPRNCGACGNACPRGVVCVDGVCACVGLRPMVCDGVCVDITTNPIHCGACHRYCGGEAVCIAGSCVCIVSSRSRCDSRCVDLRSDTDDCGACGHACDAFGACVDGVCVGRGVAPLAGERLGTRQPTFRWTSGDAMVDVCADRDCTRVIESHDGTAARGVTTTRRLEPGVYFWRLRARGGAGAPAQVSFRIDARDTANEGLLPGTIDINGDGLADVFVRSATSVFVFNGTRATLPVSADNVVRVSDGEQLDLTPPHPAGDLNNDGSVDVELLLPTLGVWIQGDPQYTATTWGLRERGPVFAVGDINRDGLTDWLLLSDGAVFVAPGIVINRFTVEGQAADAPAVAGGSEGPRVLAALGDVDGDGVRDVAIAAPEASPPQAHVLLGSSEGFRRTWTAPSAPRSTGFGAWVASAGDINGDGHADLLAGYANDAGAVVYLGGEVGLSLHRALIDASGDALVIASAGDVDGDGYSDLVVLHRARDAQLYRGGRDGLAATPVTLTDARWHDVETLHSPGDIDGDGFDDLVAGAAWRDTVYVFHGAARDAYTRVETLRGPTASGFGRSVL